jgi:hypothetical protein
VTLNPVDVYPLLQRFMAHGPNQEYKALEAKMGFGWRHRITTYWQYIRDAVDGTGGFTNGLYLYPYRLEYNNGIAEAKLKERREQADYDNFAKDVCNAAWEQIIQSRVLIVRKSEDKDLENFWLDCDGTGTSMTDFWEYTMRQSRMFGTGYVCIDRPSYNPVSAADDVMTDDNRPYIYAIPSQNVLDWTFDSQGDLNGILIIEPDEQEMTYTEGVTGSVDLENHGGLALDSPHYLRIWTNHMWARFKAITPEYGLSQIANADPLRPGNAYQFVEGGVNQLGEIPIVMLFNDYPGPKRLIGHSEMIDVARIAQTVYNIDSEAREIERKCALFLAMPVKDAKGYDSKQIVVGTDSMMVYDGDAGKPEWITPNLDALDKLAHKRQEKIDSAYNMAHLRVLINTIQTKSGYHAEVEFQKTVRRIAYHAEQLEDAEMHIARLFLKYKGAANQLNDGVKFEITYPREFGVQDIERQMARTQILIGMQLGDQVNKETVEQLFRTVWPRKSNDEIMKMVDDAVISLKAAEAAALGATMGGANPAATGATPGKPGNGKDAAAGGSGKPPTPQPTSTMRLKTLMERISATQAASTIRPQNIQ